MATRISKLSTVIAITSCLILSGCGSSNPEFDEALSKMESLVVDYEKTVEKNPFCQSDMMNLLTTITPKLNDLNQSINKIQNSNNKPSASALAKYSDLASRMSKAVVALSSKKPTC